MTGFPVPVWLLFKTYHLLPPFLFLVGVLLFPLLGQSFILDRVIVVVNGDLITASDFRTAEVIHISKKSVHRDAFLERLIDEKLLIKEAKRFEIPNPEEDEIRLSLLTLKERYQSEKVFQKLLKEKGITLEMVNKGLKDQLIIKRFLDQRINFFVLVTPKELNHYYEIHMDDYREREFDDLLQGEIEQKLIHAKAEKKKQEYLSKLRKNSEIRMVHHSP